MALKCFGEAFHSAPFLQARLPGNGRRSFAPAHDAPRHQLRTRLDACTRPVRRGRGAAASKTIPEGPQPTKARPGRANSPPQQRHGVREVAAWR
jgi:hypothetical protein